MHGAGVIKAIEEEILGETQEYYVINIPIKKWTL